MSGEKSVKRIKFTDKTWSRIKVVANGEDSSNLESFYRKAVDDYYCNGELSEETDYLSPPRVGTYHSLWLDKESMNKVKKISTRDRAYENRVIYTAILNFLSN
jgi:hypothetical protein